jgi:CBS domain-containing protein
LAEVVKIMRSNGLRRLPVVDQHGTLAGVITANDALTAASDLLQQLSEVLVVEPSLRDRLMASQSRLDRLQSQKG